MSHAPPPRGFGKRFFGSWEETTMTLQIRFTVVVLIILAATSAFGQGFQGGLRGAARDAGGGLVPGVEVTLTNEATSLSRTTVTNDSGEYSFASLDPGSYRLKASLTGFKAIDLEGVRRSEENTSELQSIRYYVWC